MVSYSYMVANYWGSCICGWQLAMGKILAISFSSFTMECIPIAYKGKIWGWQVSAKLHPSIITVCTVLIYSTEVAKHNIPEGSVTGSNRSSY